MSKIICDVCGSAYADTADVCPICGTAKTDRSKTFTNAAAQDASEAGGYTYIKGGRFSHSNVRKRTSGKELPRSAAAPKRRDDAPSQPPAEDDNSPSNRGLVIIVIILLIAIIAVCVYIGVRFLDMSRPSGTNPPQSSTSTNSVDGVKIPCSDVKLESSQLDVSSDAPLQIVPQITPANTTDQVLFLSSDDAIATVDGQGNVTVLASGEVTITVVCGEFNATCVLNCTYVDPSAPSDPTDPTQPTPPPAELKLTREDMTSDQYGFEFKLYDGPIDTALITFTSSDTKVVTVDATGKIKVVGKGTATITATYGDQTATCIVRCEKVEIPGPVTYELNYTDVTIKVGDTVHIKLLDKTNGDAPVAGLNWYLSMEGYATIAASSTGVKVTGTEVTVGVPGVAYVRVMVEYEGVTYQCKIRVKSAG